MLVPVCNFPVFCPLIVFGCFIFAVKTINKTMKRLHDQKKNWNALLRTPEEIIDTYGLYSPKGSRKAALVGKPLRSGSVSLCIYSYRGGRGVRESVGVVLQPETSQEVKNANKEAIEEWRGKIDAGLVSAKKPQTLTAYAAKRLAGLKGGCRYAAAECLRRIKEYEARRGDGDVMLPDVSADWVRGFVNYLSADARNNRIKDRGAARGLSQNTVLAMFTQLGAVLNDAVRRGQLASNPAALLSRHEKPRYEADKRIYLSLREVEALMSTPCGGAYPDVARAFLFCCFVGLRFSDVRALTPESVAQDSNGTYIRFTVKKTGARQMLYIGRLALEYLPQERTPGRPLFRLPTNAVANAMLKSWAKDAGISGKKVTFHVSRHTAATLMLNGGARLEDVGFQLGHKRLSTTQIYAKITGQTQRQAVAAFDAWLAGRGAGGCPPVRTGD